MSNINLVNNGFPLAKISLRRGEKIKIENGSMVYKSMGINLKTRLNASGSNGLTRFIKATARAAVSGESTFVTEAIADNDGLIAIAPTMPGHIAILQCGKKQYCINDGAFLALTGDAEYKMKSQGFGKAMFGGTGGFFVMETSGESELLINSFGTLEKIDLNNDFITIAHINRYQEHRRLTEVEIEEIVKNLFSNIENEIKRNYREKKKREELETIYIPEKENMNLPIIGYLQEDNSIIIETEEIIKTIKERIFNNE